MSRIATIRASSVLASLAGLLLLGSAALSGCSPRQTLAAMDGGGNGAAMLEGGRTGERQVTARFSGPKANTGTAIHTHHGRERVLTLSDDFKVPDTPAPHWQVVDSRGNAYLLQRLVVKGDKLNKSITVPSYVPDIARVQIWCAWAETLLGEASFEMPVK
jgi:hypothetical protein